MSNDLIEKYVNNLGWIREQLLAMDELCSPVMGVKDWDDSVIINFEGKQLVVSVDGPYTKRLVMKSALVHAATDVLVKGAKPLFALDTLIGLKSDVQDMIASLKKQANDLKLPLLGGNTLFGAVEPRCSLTVVGKLLTEEPIRDNNAQIGDLVCLLGEPIWGEQDERLKNAGKLFETWFDAISKVKINSAKDVTKGGLVSVVYEMESKSNKRFNLLDKIKYPVSRNLDNFILTLTEVEFKKLEKIAMSHKCPLEKIGVVESI